MSEQPGMKASVIASMTLTAVLLGASGSIRAQAQSSEGAHGFWVVQTSVYTRHFSPSPDHTNRQDLLGLERNEASGLLYGGATFRNSFAQRSFYGYVGKRFDSRRYPLYLKVTGGLLKGYKGRYRDKIPLNRQGIAPVIIPGAGVQLGVVSAEAVLLGASAAMINVGLRF